MSGSALPACQQPAWRGRRWSVSGPRAQALVTAPPTVTGRCSTPARCCVLAQRRAHSRCNATDPRDTAGPSSAQPEGGRGVESTPASRFPVAPEPGKWFRDNDAFIRASPLYVGAAAILSLVANRVLSGEALATDASTAQSRAEVIVLALSTALVLTGLNWIALTPREPVTVTLTGERVMFINPEVAPEAAQELRWLWSALGTATRTQACAVFYRRQRMMQAGPAPAGCATPVPPDLSGICAQVMASGTANYFANVSLYPGRFEFFTFMPANSQALIVQPLGTEGVLVAACGTQRGFTTADQRWLALVAQKLDSTLDACVSSPPWRE